MTEDEWNQATAPCAGCVLYSERIDRLEAAVAEATKVVAQDVLLIRLMNAQLCWYQDMVGWFTRHCDDAVLSGLQQWEDEHPKPRAEQ